MRPSVLEATVESPDVVTSPVPGSDRRGAVVQLELVEGGAPLGLVNLGDTLALRTEDGRSVRIVVGRATIVFDPDDGAASVLAHALPEIVPILRRSTGSAPVEVRERVLRHGDRVRLRAVLEGSQVRDDRAPVVVEVSRLL